MFLKKTRTLERVDCNEGCDERLLRQTSRSPSLALMDVPGSQMVAALVIGSPETRQVQLFSLTFEQSLGIQIHSS